MVTMRVVAMGHLSKRKQVVGRVGGWKVSQRRREGAEVGDRQKGRKVTETNTMGSRDKIIGQ